MLVETRIPLPSFVVMICLTLAFVSVLFLFFFLPAFLSIVSNIRWVFFIFSFFSFAFRFVSVSFFSFFVVAWSAFFISTYLLAASYKVASNLVMNMQWQIKWLRNRRSNDDWLFDFFIYAVSNMRPIPMWKIYARRKCVHSMNQEFSMT